MHATTLQVGRFPIAVAFVLSLLLVNFAYADQITLMWDANSDQVNGYAVYVGSSPRVDVGNTTSYTLTNAVAGQQYCFAVAAYNASGEGPKSGQLCGYSNRFPTLTNPGNRTATAGQATSLQLSGSDPDGQPLTYAATGLPPGLFIGTATGFIQGTPTTAGTFSATASVFDGVLNSPSQTFTWTVAPAADTTAPTVSVTSHSEGQVVTTSTVTLAGTAADNVGVTGVTINGQAATGTTAWSRSVALTAGTNTFTVVARDAAGNTTTQARTITYQPPPPADTAPPTVAITSHTNGQVVTTSTITLAGTAADNVGVTSVTVNSAAATGTTSWSRSVTLVSGSNSFTVRATDAAGNVVTQGISITYQAPAPLDTTPPSLSIVDPSAPTVSTTRNVVTLGGTASDNMGVTAVTWASDRPGIGPGVASGTTTWSVSTVPLVEGSNVITVTAQDAAGNKKTAALTVTYTVAAPTTCTSQQMTQTMKNGVVDTWLAARAAEGWVLVSRTKTRNMTTVTLSRCV